MSRDIEWGERERLTDSEILALMPGDLIGAWTARRDGGARAEGRVEFHGWSKRTPCLMRVLATYGQCLVCAPFGSDGRWSAAAVMVRGGSIACAGPPDEALLAKAETDMPRFRLHVAKLIEGEQSLRLLGRICRSDWRQAVVAACGLPEGADLWFGQHGLSEAFREVDALEAQWAPPAVEPRRSR